MRTIIVNTPGPQGPQGSTGPTGSQGPSVPFTNLGNGVYTTTSSLQVTGSFLVSGSSTFTNIGPALFSGSISVSGSLIVNGYSAVTTNQTSSLNVLSASYASTASLAPNYVLNSATSSFITNTQTGSFATTGSNQFNGNQTITGSLIQGLGNAAGENSHAEGDSTQAIGSFSHAEGLGTIAYGGRSHAEGQDTIASGSYSHAEGYQTIALADHQHVQGQWNATSSVPAAFIVGNGTDDSNRSNLIHAAGNEFQITGSLNVSGSITGSLFGTASFASTASFYSGPTTTTFVGNCNSFSIPNVSLFYGAYLGGTPVNPTTLTTRTGSFANGFFPGYPMPAGTASNLTLIIATTQSSNNTSFVYIANANSAITGSVITLAAGSAAGIYSSSANPVSFAQGDRLTVILRNPFVAGSSGSATITTFSFIYRNT